MPCGVRGGACRVQVGFAAAVVFIQQALWLRGTTDCYALTFGPRVLSLTGHTPGRRAVHDGPAPSSSSAGAGLLMHRTLGPESTSTEFQGTKLVVRQLVYDGMWAELWLWTPTAARPNLDSVRACAGETHGSCFAHTLRLRHVRARRRRGRLHDGCGAAAATPILPAQAPAHPS
jgi:hypothetical protein